LPGGAYKNENTSHVCDGGGGDDNSISFSSSSSGGGGGGDQSISSIGSGGDNSVSVAAVPWKYAEISFSNCTFTFSPTSVLANGHTNTKLILRGD